MPTTHAEVATAYIEIITARGDYEDYVFVIPDCAGYLDQLTAEFLGSMGDVLGMTLAIHADPDNRNLYEAEIERIITQRMEFFVFAIENELQYIDDFYLF